MSLCDNTFDLEFLKKQTKTKQSSKFRHLQTQEADSQDFLASEGGNGKAELTFGWSSKYYLTRNVAQYWILASFLFNSNLFMKNNKTKSCFYPHKDKHVVFLCS